MPGRSLERRTVKEVGREPAIAECYCTKLKFVCKQLIINELLEEFGSRTIRRVDNTQVIDSRNCHNG
jgi:hypothetical protein